MPGTRTLEGERAGLCSGDEPPRSGVIRRAFPGTLPAAWQDEAYRQSALGEAQQQLAEEAQALISSTPWAVLQAEMLVAKAEVNRLAGGMTRPQLTCARRRGSLRTGGKCLSPSRPKPPWPASSLIFPSLRRRWPRRLQQDFNRSPTPSADARVKRLGDRARRRHDNPPEGDPAMYVHDQLMKARQDDLLRAAARDRLTAQARRARSPRRHHHLVAAPVRRRPPCACASSSPNPAPSISRRTP